MRFLKPEIFYSEFHNLPKVDKEILDNIKLEYVEYLKKIESKYNKKLFNYYYLEGFHDYSVYKLTFEGDAWNYNKDKIILELRCDDIEISIIFKNIVYFKFSNENKICYWHSFDGVKPVSRGIEEVLLCELGITDDGYNTFEFLTSSGGVFEVHFKNAEFEKRIENTKRNLISKINSLEKKLEKSEKIIKELKNKKNK